MMKKYLIINPLILLLFLMPGLFGCLPVTRRAVVTPMERTPALSIEELDKKIAYLTDLMDQKKLDPGDTETARKLLDAYKTIKSHSWESRSYDDQREVTRILFNNLSMLDEKFFLKTRADDHLYKTALALFSSMRKKILDNYIAGNYQGVINDCLELESTFGHDALLPEIGLLFAVSLAKKGMLEEAVNIGNKILRKLEGMPDIIHLRAHIAEWQLDLGNRKKALRIYEKLTDDMDERNAVINETGRIVSGKEKRVARKEKIEPDNGSVEKKGPMDQSPMEKLLHEVDNLVSKNKFDEAKLLLIKYRIRYQDEPETETIDQAMKSLELAEERYQNEKQSRESLENETIRLAKRLIEEENYKEAISRLDKFGDGKEMTPEAKELKDLATEKLINRERNRAAKLFLKAKKTSDPAQKETLLISSYKILKNLVDKYPSSDLINKINSHISKVKEELLKLGKVPG